MSANTAFILVITSLILVYIIEYHTCVAAVARNQDDDALVSLGKYNKRKFNRGNNGKYVPAKDEGVYVATDKWKYRHYDDGNRGRYFHIDIPYDGGYGNYEGGHEPYRTPAYDPTGEYSNNKFESVGGQSSNNNNDDQDPFGTEEYFIPRPPIYLEYGLPGQGDSFQTARGAKQQQLLADEIGDIVLTAPDNLLAASGRHAVLSTPEKSATLTAIADTATTDLASDEVVANVEEVRPNATKKSSPETNTEISSADEAADGDQRQTDGIPPTEVTITPSPSNSDSSELSSMTRKI